MFAGHARVVTKDIIFIRILGGDGGGDGSGSGGGGRKASRSKAKAGQVAVWTDLGGRLLRGKVHEVIV